MELWTHQVEQTTSVQQSIHVTQDMFSMEISQEHVKRMQTGVEVNQLVMVCRLTDKSKLRIGVCLIVSFVLIKSYLCAIITEE